MPAGLHHVRDHRAPGAPPLLLLAGIGSSSDAWRPVVPLLAPERDVWRLDLPGFGGSDALPSGAPCGIDALADAVERFLDEVGLDRPHVAGNSLGGGVALELGRRDRVASVTALSPSGFAGPLGAKWADESLKLTYWAAGRLEPVARRAFRRPGLRRLLMGQMYAHPERLRPGEAYTALLTLRDGKGFLGTLAALDGHRFAGEIDVPVTIAWGTRDALLVPAQALRARRLLPGARHAWLRGCGHVPMSDDPELVARVLLDGSTAPRPAQNAVASANG